MGSKANEAADGKPSMLGLTDEASVPGTERWEPTAGTGTVFTQPEPENPIELTVIVPARNEEECLGACLQSLVSQSEEIFKLSQDWELIVVDDRSTDGTAQIAASFSEVTVIEAGELKPLLAWKKLQKLRVDTASWCHD
jgi:cellulose synthase/poly-beta-1,6-N-acetylglucosamine synthase-like glycosyltransferase